MPSDPDDMLLRGMAEMAFGLGLEHGKTRATPLDSESLMGALEQAFMHSCHGIAWRIIHRKKLRQVYGAGFDIHHTIRSVEKMKEST